MTTLPPTAIQSPSTPLPSVPSISLLPFHIAHSGPAQISKYFITRPRPQKRPFGQSPTPAAPVNPSESTTPISSEASFRGRLVVSTPLLLPDAYTGLVFSTTVPVPRPSAADIQREQEEEAERVAKKLKREEQQSKKAILAASVPLGRRTSPRKRKPVGQAPRQRFSMDDDDDDDDAEANAPLPTIEPEVAAVPIEEEATQEESQPDPEPAATLLPPPLPPTSHPLLTALSSSSSLLSTPNTPLPASQDDSQPTDEPDATPLQRDVRLLIPQVKFNAIQIWNPDMELDLQMDLYWRGVEEWTEVASKIHAY